MTALANRQIKSKNVSTNNDSLIDSVRILWDITRKDIEKSYNIDNYQDTEAFYSNRYGWSLRKTNIWFSIQIIIVNIFFSPKRKINEYPRGNKAE